MSDGMSACPQSARMPALYVCHGGGPFPLLTPPMGGTALTEHLRSISSQPPEKPKAILAISAHWEEGDEVAVTSSVQPPLVFDYYGFPPHTYQYRYDAPGDPELASRVCSLLTAKGHPCRLDAARGLDHGVFVPLLLAYPAADIPVICLSLHRSLDAKLHLSIGQALRPLRDEGVLLLGSGMSFHNMRAFVMSGRSDQGGELPAGARFDEALVAAVTTRDLSARTASLAAWTALPDARLCHPRAEHLLPLMVAAGAASDNEPATRMFGGTYMGAVISGFRFG
jgi:aromatic ring-opening dioxygenase catalytic subunit (LigB family)